VHNPGRPHLSHATPAHPTLHVGQCVHGMQKVEPAGVVHPRWCAGCAHTHPQCVCITLLAQQEGGHHLPGSSAPLHNAPPPSPVCVMSLGCAQPHSCSPFACAWGQGEWARGAHSCGTPTHKWMEGTFAPLLCLLLCPVSHTQGREGGGYGGHPHPPPVVCSACVHARVGHKRQGWCHVPAFL
jgi:hypothetical protein